MGTGRWRLLGRLEGESQKSALSGTRDIEHNKERQSEVQNHKPAK